METEQITDDSVIQNSEEVKKVKNPRKVAAGKALAKKNAEARGKKKIVADSEVVEKESSSMSTIYNGIQKSAILVSSGFVLYHGFNFFKDIYSKQVLKDKQSQSPAPTPEPQPQSQSIESNDLDF